MNYSLKIIIAMIGTGLSAARGYSQDAALSWKTYANSKYGFSFQYPGTWVIDKDADVVVAGTVTSRSVHFTDTISKTFLLIGYSLSKGAEIYNFYIANYDSSRSKHITVDGTDAIQITTIDNKNGKGRRLNRKDQGKEIDVEFLDKKKTGEFELKFRASLNGSLISEIKKFNHLVHSFKFLK